MLDLTPILIIPSFEQEVILPGDFGGELAPSVGGFQAAPGELRQGKVAIQGLQERILIGDATAPTTGTGIFIGSDGNSNYDFRAGNPSGNYLHWDGSAATLTISGSITASAIDIGGSDATSFHVDTDGNMWLGASTFAAAPAKISNAGVGTFSNINISGGQMTGVPISAIPNNTLTDISLLEATHDLVFSVTDADTVAWATGTITLSNGRTFSISSGNTGNMAARTYIYLDTAVSSTVLQTTTTVSNAMGGNKKLIAVCQNGTAQPQYTVYGGIGGLKIPGTATPLAVNNWALSSVWSVTDADTIAWGAGTLSTSDGGSYSIASGNTGNMAAKTYIYFNLAVSTTALQTTTSAATATGEGKILIAIAQNGTGEANYMVVNDKQSNIDAAQIVAGSITANEIAASTITAGKLSVSQLSAIAADMGALTAGTITLNSSGHIKSGQTAFDTGTGFWLGLDSGVSKFSIGISTGAKITWDGTALNVDGISNNSDFFVAGEALTAGDAVFVADGTETDNPTIDQGAPFAEQSITTTTDWYAQTFTTRAATDAGLLLSTVAVMAVKGIAFGNMRISIRAVDGSNKPTGSDLAYYDLDFSAIGGTSGYRGGTLTSPITLTASTVYAVVIRHTSTDGGAVAIGTEGSSADPNGVGWSSTDSGANWSSYGSDISISVPVTFTTAGKVYKTTSKENFGSDGMYSAFIGFARSTVALGATTAVVIAGAAPGVGLTIGANYYLGETNGSISATPGSHTRKVGIAISSTKLLITNIW